MKLVKRDSKKIVIELNYNELKTIERALDMLCSAHVGVIDKIYSMWAMTDLKKLKEIADKQVEYLYQNSKLADEITAILENRS